MVGEDNGKILTRSSVIEKAGLNLIKSTHIHIEHKSHGKPRSTGGVGEGRQCIGSSAENNTLLEKEINTKCGHTL